MTPTGRQVHRFRGKAATTRSVDLAGVATVSVILAAALVGIVAEPLAFFAVGAGAGYSLSGSV